MKVLSFDLGLRHLAWICLTFENGQPLHIDHWHCDSAVDDTVNVNATSLEVLVPYFVKCLDTIWTLVNVHELSMVLIESQPMGHGRSFGGTSMGGSPRNLKTKVFSHILQSFLLQQRPDLPIHFVSPTLKMKGCTIPFRERSYKDNKKYAIQATEDFFKTASEGLLQTYEDIFVKASTKKDDLSDCFLQAKVFVEALHNGSLILTESKPIEKNAISKKKTGAKKTETESEAEPKQKRKPDAGTKRKREIDHKTTEIEAKPKAKKPKAKRQKAAELAVIDDA
jgi:hypothetical protein